MINIFSLAKFLPFNLFTDSSTIGIIGGADGPTSIYVNGAHIAPSLMATIAVFIGAIFVWFVISALITVFVTLYTVNKYKAKKPSDNSYGYGGANPDNSENGTNANSSSEDK